jgi:hypothetical protein
LSKYQDYLKSLTSKVNDQNSKKKNGKSGKATQSFSRQDWVGINQSLLNDPDHEVKVYTKNPKDKNGGPVAVASNPSKDYRASLKKVARTLGVDEAESAKLDTMQFTKDHAESVAKIAQHAVKDFISIGRKFTLPMTSPKETQMSISRVRAEAKEIANRKITNEGTENKPKWKSNLTGTVTETAEHYRLRAQNRTPAWLKKVKKAK